MARAAEEADDRAGLAAKHLRPQLWPFRQLARPTAERLRGENIRYQKCVTFLIGASGLLSFALYLLLNRMSSNGHERLLASGGLIRPDGY